MRREFTTVFLDSSFILSMIRNRRPLDEEIRIAVLGPVRISVLDSVVMELQRLARNGKFSTAALAKIALKTFERETITVAENTAGIPDVDTSILAAALAEKSPTVVATVDKNLRSVLLKHELRAVFPRNRKGLTRGSTALRAT